VHRQQLLNVWLQKLHLTNFRPTSTSYICGAHFEPDMFTEGSVVGKRKVLRVCNVPSG